MSKPNPAAEAEKNLPAPAVAPSSNYLRDKIAEDLKSGKFKHVQTRFPPEPNGYLHIGHAKAICLDLGLADECGGRTNLRFDDTNPEREEQEYVDAIQEDVRWLGYDWECLCFASDYFGQLYEWAVKLIRDGKAYVDDLNADQVRQYRGTLTQPGTDSPYRNRSAAENLDLFERMRKGEFPDGSRTLRAKIDMASPNFNLRDPIMNKRKLRQLVEERHVTGWDDPRMPTLGGMRRRGYTPEAIRNFVAAAGVSRTNGVVDLAMLEHFVREDLNKRSPRVMAVLRPLKVVIDN